MIGRTISHYKVLEKLGEGGMGVVYLAEDTKLERKVAIKFLPRHIAAGKQDRQRFEMEAKAAAALNHPNIATIYAIEEYDKEMFIVMEYIEGRELGEIIQSEIPNPQSAIDYAVQIAEGLQAAHEKGIIHRDIKPANLMISEKGRVKIMDFGLAKITGSALLDERGLTLGTAAYMSPEQVNGKDTDQRSDIWSFGVVLYELLAGKLPFPGDYIEALLYSIRFEDPPPLPEERDDIPEKLKNIATKALKKDPSQRYQRMDEVLLDLASLSEEPKSGLTKKSGADLTPALSIAVLPFADISPQKDQEYFCDGIAEELIDALARIEDWRVVSRTSAFAFKGKEQDIRQIGAKLNVSYVLEGSVRKAGNRLRITTQLSNVEDGFQLFSEKYDRELEDVFAIQDDLARIIVNKLKIRLVDENKTPFIKHYTENSKAYQHYLKGRYFLNKGTSENTQKSITHFERALAEDPNYALAYSGLADAHILLGGTFSAPLSPGDALPKAKAAALKAMEIDDTLAEAHTSLAFVKFWYDWDWPGAEEEFKRAIELKPGYTRACQWYAEYLSAMQRHEEAIAMINRALQLDPLSVHVSWHVGKIFFLARQYNRAIEQCRKALEMDSNFIPARSILRRVYEQKGMADETIKELQRISGKGEKEIASLKQTYKKSGWKGIWQKQLEWIKKENYPPLRYAELYSRLEERDKAFEWLEKAYQQRSSSLVYLNVYASFDNLRPDPRFSELLRKIGL